MATLYYDQFVKYNNLGIESLKAGQDDRAIDYFLKAAYYGVQSAKSLSGELSEERLISCQRLREYAEELIEMQEKQEQKKKGVAAKNDHGKTDGDDKWIMKRKPNVKLSDVAGMEEVKELIQTKIMDPFQYPDTWAKYKLEQKTGILMYGPPGNGKTYIAAAIANELDAAFFPVNISKIMSKWVGSTEQNLASLFREAREKATECKKSVVFLDEIDALVSHRGSGSTVMDRAIPQFLNEVDGIESKGSNLLLLGATNVPWKIDRAAVRPDRFGNQIYVGLPDRKARKKIFELNMKDVPFEKGLDFIELAKLTDGYSAADIKQICTEAKEMAFKREKELIDKNIDYNEDEMEINKSDFEYVLKNRKPSVDKKMLQKYLKYKKDH